MERIYTYGAVPRTSLDVTIDADDTGITLDSATGWPDTGPFMITIERDTPNEERIEISARSGTTLTVSGRGRDGTTARSHTAGSTCWIEHTLSGDLIDAMNEGLARQTTKGDLLAHDGTDLVRKAAGTNGLPLVARSSDSTGLAYETLAAAALGTGSVTGVKIADDAVDSQHYADGSIDTAHLSDDVVTRAKVGYDTVVVLDRDNTSVTVSNTVTETVLVSFDIPAGDAANNIVYHAVIHGSYRHQSATGCEYGLHAKLNGTDIVFYLAPAVASASDSLEYPWQADIWVHCTGTATQKVRWNLKSASLGGASVIAYDGDQVRFGTMTKDMAGASTISMYIQMGTADAGHTATFLHGYLERLGPA